jgi:hypothetical protein
MLLAFHQLVSFKGELYILHTDTCGWCKMFHRTQTITFHLVTAVKSHSCEIHDILIYFNNTEGFTQYNQTMAKQQKQK